MNSIGTIGTTCALVTSLIGGRVHDRNSVARDFEITVASADRYLNHLSIVPGFVTVKRGRRRALMFSFAQALNARGVV